MTEPYVTTPARFIPLEAMAFGAVGGAATPVSAESPLPVYATTVPASTEALEGTADASMTMGPFAPELARPINLTLSGGWSGTVTVLRSIDGGSTKLGLTVAGEPWGVFTGNCNEPVWEESEAAATFYLSFERISGTLAYRVAQ